jgi:hypothetical protein
MRYCVTLGFPRFFQAILNKTLYFTNRNGRPGPISSGFTMNSGALAAVKKPQNTTKHKKTL